MWSPNQAFCFLCHGLALNSTSTKLYTMQIGREINKATPKRWRSLFEMLYQESNREKRLNSKGMSGLEPIKTTDCGKQRQLLKQGKHWILWKVLKKCGEAVCKLRKWVLMGTGLLSSLIRLELPISGTHLWLNATKHSTLLDVQAWKQVKTVLRWFMVLKC